MSYWVAGAAIVGAIGSAMIEKDGAGKANKQTQAGIASASQTIKDSAAEGKGLLDPAVGVGMSSLPVIQQSLQDQSAAGEQGTNQLKDLSSQSLDVNKYVDPNMAFAQKEGQKAIEASAAARGNLVSGATLKALTKYGTDTANQNWNNAAQLALADKNQNIGASTTLAGQGNNALSGLLDIYGSGVNAAGKQADIVGSTGTNIANLQMSAANSAAATTAAKSSSDSGMFGGIMGGIGSMFSDENAKVGISDPKAPKVAAAPSGSKLQNAYETWKTNTASGLTFLGRPVTAPAAAPVASNNTIRRPNTNQPTMGDNARTLTLMSDIHSKDALGDVNDMEIDRFLSAVNPKEFKYNEKAKAAGAPEGDQTGVVAQDLEKSKIGKRLVKEDPNTGYKQIDVPQTVGTLLAVNASLNKRLKKVEKK